MGSGTTLVRLTVTGWLVSMAWSALASGTGMTRVQFKVEG
jgi:hypothetical protein